jgi:hypothetical protein
MDKELQEYFEIYFDLFQHKGWNQLMKDLQEILDGIDILNLDNAKDLHLVQGKLSMLNQILNWQDSITNSHDSNLFEESDSISILQ